MRLYQTVPFSDVKLDIGFWHNRQELNRTSTLYAVMNRFKETGRFDAFRCDWREGMPNKPHIFYDSDVAKWMESVSYESMRRSMPDLEAEVEKLIDLIEEHADKHGYFNVWYLNIEPTKRFTVRGNHELYCAGHLIEAAVAHHQATGKDRFLKLMCKYADYIYRVFVVERSARFVTPGHEEIELALVKLYRATGEKRYLDLTRFFLDQRGNNDIDCDLDSPGARALQSHMPVREMRTAEGHSVRAGYLYSAMADVAGETGDEALFAACAHILDNILNKRMYITGGVGSSRYQEAFTLDYDLQNELAYTETCAAIALIYFAQRMLRIKPDARYADTVERALYNCLLSGVSLDGKSFFYTNPMEVNLAHHGRNVCENDHMGEWLPNYQRSEVFSCSCCPPNVTRIIASVAEYQYTHSDDTLFLHQYMGGTACIQMGGREVRIVQRTNYPWDGRVEIAVQGAAGLRLALRVPGWCESFALNAKYIMEDGYAYFDCADDMRIVFDMAMEPRLMEAHSAVRDNAGRACLMRGPLVYCLESVDNVEPIQSLRVCADLNAILVRDEAMSLIKLEVNGTAPGEPQADALYRPLNTKRAAQRLIFIPYYAMENRGACDMQVWVQVEY